MKQSAAIPNKMGSRQFYFFRKWLFAVACLGLVFTGFAVSADPVIKRVVFKEASIRDVIQYLKKSYVFNVVLRLDKDEESKLPLISFDFSYVPPGVVIKYACLAAGLNYYSENGVLIIGKDLKIPFKYYPADFKNRRILEEIPAWSGMTVGTTYYVPLNVGQPQVVNNGNTVTITTPPVKWVKFQSGTTLGDVVKEQNEAARQPRTVKRRSRPTQPAGIVIAKRSPIMERRLRQIIIPKIDIEDMPVTQLVELLHKLSIQNDPYRRGINFYLVKTAAANDTLISGNLNKMTLEDVIKYLFMPTGIEYMLDHYVVVLYSGQEPGKK